LAMSRIVGVTWSAGIPLRTLIFLYTCSAVFPSAGFCWPAATYEITSIKPAALLRVLIEIDLVHIVSSVPALHKIKIAGAHKRNCRQYSPPCTTARRGGRAINKTREATAAAR